MNRLDLIKVLVAFDGNGAEVYELLDGELFKRKKIGNTVGELIFATYEAWQSAGFYVTKGQKAAIWDSGKSYFSFDQVDELDQWYEQELWDAWDFHHDHWGDRDPR